MPGNICLNVAERRVREYTDESDALMRDGHEAQDFLKCQEFIQKGINAYRWLRNAEEFLREADYQGLFAFTPDVQNAVESLYKTWLNAGETAKERIAENLACGVELQNLEEFRNTCEVVEETIQNREWREAAARARILTSSANEDGE